jgi:DNA-binding transcriptional regulator YiaG
MNSTMTGGEARALREALKFTQEQWAKVLGVRARTVSRWETHGNIPEPVRRLMLMLVATTAPKEEEK